MYTRTHIYISRYFAMAYNKYNSVYSQKKRLPSQRGVNMMKVVSQHSLFGGTCTPVCQMTEGLFKQQLDQGHCQPQMRNHQI